MVVNLLEINPDETKISNILKAINEIHRHIEESSKKSLIDKISKRLTELESKSNHLIESKCLKNVAKKNFSIIIKHAN